jgi:deazaflavin-dependent oxidoreductase (nitroreductase family)
LKRRASKFLTVRIVNPLVRWAAGRGLAGRSVALLETTGRKSGQKRVTPVGNSLRGDAFWIVTEHGWGSSYVKNMQADPHVRVEESLALQFVPGRADPLRYARRIL